MLGRAKVTQVIWLCTLGSVFSQTADVLGRLREYYQAYDRWASQYTLTWEISYWSSLNKTKLLGNLHDEKIREAISRADSEVKGVFRVEIRRKAELSSVVIEHVRGFWPPDSSKTHRTYRGIDWLSMEMSEAHGGEAGQEIPLVQVIPMIETGSVLFHPYDLSGFLYQLHPSFFAASNPFEEAFCCEPRLNWQVEKVQKDIIWLKSQGWQGKDVEYRLGCHSTGRLMEYQMLYQGQIRHRIKVVKYQLHGKFYVPSFVVVEWQTPSESARFEARLLQLRESGNIRIEHPEGAYVSDFRLMKVEEVCRLLENSSDYITTKVVHYRWQGHLPTLDELQRMYQQANPQGSAISIPPSHQSRWLLYLPGLLLIAVGVYLWWRGQRGKAMG